MNASIHSDVRPPKLKAFRWPALAALVLLGFGAMSRPALAQGAPVAAGTMRYSNSAAWGRWEGFTTTSNTFGFFARITYQGGHVMTVVPFRTEADGQVQCWFIDYILVGATNPNNTQGWQWVETGGGRIFINPATAVAGVSVDGTMAWTYTGTQNYQRQPINNPQFFGIKFTNP